MQLNKLIEEYLLELKSSCKKSTHERNESIIRIYIKPFFNNHDHVPLEVKKINLWKSWLLKFNLADATNKKIFQTLSSILNYGYRVYGIENTMHRVKTFKRTKPINTINFYTLDEFMKYYSVIDNLQCKLFFLILFFGGLRRGEVLALKWGDIENNKININKSCRRGVISSTKNIYSVRVVSVPNIVVKLLCEYKSQRCKQTPTDKIFTYSETSLARFNKIYSRKANLKTIRLHDFRHSHITYLFYLGFTPMAIAKRVGHKDLEQLFNTYAHLIDHEEKNIINKLNLDSGIIEKQ